MKWRLRGFPSGGPPPVAVVGWIDVGVRPVVGKLASVPVRNDNGVSTAKAAK